MAHNALHPGRVGRRECFASAGLAAEAGCRTEGDKERREKERSIFHINCAARAPELSGAVCQSPTERHTREGGEPQSRPQGQTEGEAVKTNRPTNHSKLSGHEYYAIGVRSIFGPPERPWRDYGCPPDGINLSSTKTRQTMQNQPPNETLTISPTPSPALILPHSRLRMEKPLRSSCTSPSTTNRSPLNQPFSTQMS